MQKGQEKHVISFVQLWVYNVKHAEKLIVLDKQEGVTDTVNF